MRTLVQEGIDQCQSSLKRLQSRSQYDQYKDTTPSDFDRRVEARSFRLDEVDSSVQNVIKRLVSLIKSIPADDTGDDELLAEDDGWADAEDSGTPEKHLGDDSPLRLYGLSPLSQFDPHPHARRKPRSKSSSRTRRTSASDTTRHRATSSLRLERSGSEFSQLRLQKDGRADSLFRNDGSAHSTMPINQQFRSGFSQSSGKAVVPDLDRLLGNSGQLQKARGKRKPSDVVRTEKIVQNTEDNITRMERFLLANSDLLTPDHSSRAIKPSKRQEILKVVDNSRTVQVPGSNTLCQDLIADLSRKNSVPSSGSILTSAVASSRGVDRICEDLKKLFATGSCESLFKEALRKVSTSRTEHGPVLFQTFVALIQSQGCRTLQELMSQEIPMLRDHIALYVTMLSLLKFKLNSILKESHGDAYALLGQDDGVSFRRLLFVQLVEAVYSLVHPTGWALAIADRKKFCSFLEPLRDAFADHLPLVEKACHCVYHDLSSQVWRYNEARRMPFVSSIDPAAWELFLTSARIPDDSTTSRFASLGKILPKCEIEAAWAVIAFFAAAPSQLGTCETSRWILVHELFCRGPLFVSPDSCKLPPSGDQLRFVTAEVRNLAHTMLRGSMGTVPQQDKVLLDIFRKSITLQADDIFASTGSREALCPSVPDEKRGIKEALLLWRDTDMLTAPRERQQIKLDEVSRWILSDMAVGEWMGQSLVGPSLELSRCLLGLVLIWTDWLPTERPNRWRRYDSATKLLAKVLLQACKAKGKPTSSLQEEPRADQDLFSAAFSEIVVLPKAGLPDQRRELFLQETVAYLKVFSSLKNSNRLNAREASGARKFCDEIWGLVANDSLKTRCSRIHASEEALMISLYEGDSLRPLLAARVCSLLIFLILGIFPLGAEMRRLPESFPDTDGTTLVFLAFCLVACLDCAIDSRSPENSASVSKAIVVVLGQLCLNSREGLLETAVASTVANIFREHVIRLFPRAFQQLTSTSSSGVEEDICLIALLSLVRAVLRIDECFRYEEEHGAPAVLKNLYESLLEALRQAKPSLRCAIEQPANSLPDYSLSHQGKSLVARRAELLCSVIAEILIRINLSQGGFIVSLFRNRRALAALDADAQFDMKVRWFLSNTLCQLSPSSPRASQILREEYLVVLDTFIEVLLDTDILKKLPTCNIEGIRLRSGEAAEHKAVGQYDKFERNPSSSSRTRAEAVWLFGSFFGETLKGTQGDSVGSWELKLRNLLVNGNSELESPVRINIVNSLERECLRRIFYICGLVSFSREFPRAGVKFEVVITTVLVNSIDHLLKIQRSLLIEDQASKGTAKRSYRHAKLFFLFACYVEVHVATLTWIFREGSLSTCESISELWVVVCDRYISPLLRDDQVSLDACLTRVNQALRRENEPAQPHTTNFKDISSEYRGTVAQSLLRRCREILIPLAVAYSSGSKHPSGLLEAIIAASTKGNEDKMKLVARCFFSNTTAISERPTDFSPLSVETDKYMDELEESFPLSLETCRALSKLKQDMITILVAHYIRSERSAMQQRIGALNLLGIIFKMEHQEKHGGESLQVETLCIVARGLSSSLRTELGSAVVNDSFLVQLLSCSGLLMKLPAACVEQRAVRGLEDWCKEAEKTEHGLKQRYLLAFFTWARHIASSPLVLLEMRESLAKDKSSVLPWESELRGLEGQIFPKTNIRNVYARKSTNPSVLQPWRPSEAFKFAAQQLRHQPETRNDV